LPELRRIAISDYYLDLVLDGTIDVIPGGRLEGIHPSSTRGLQIQSPEGKWVLPNITKVICCTGYESDLDQYLDDSILKTLDYDGKDLFCPMTLCWDTLHPNLPNLAFCGMYRGPYMGVMELQGRLAAGVMSGKVQLDDATFAKALETSQHIRTHKPRAQFPHSDYIGFMDKGDLVSPAFYQSSNEELARAGQEELQEEVQKGQDGGRMSSLVLSALIGFWKFHRNIVHQNSDDRMEHVHGTVRYSRPKLDHVLYCEDGLYELTPSKSLSVFREYEYLVQEDDDILEIYFV